MPSWEQAKYLNQTEQLHQLFGLQRQACLADAYPSYDQRVRQLKTLYQIVVQHQDEIAAAISRDFSNRSIDESKLFEVMTSLNGIKHSLKHLKKWMKPSKRKVGILFQPATGYVMYQPVGVVGIVVPWNYPLFLAVGPLAQALAAGNRVILKMSEYTPEFSALFQKLIAANFSEDQVCVVTGDAQLAQQFTALAFDHLLFTGATSIARHVLHAAADNLTPVTLELGGKSPVIVAKDADLVESARRLAFGKTMNAGQTCVAPDYAFVHQSQINAFIAAYFETIKQFYPNSILQNPDYTSIVNDRQFERLQHYLEDAKDKGAVFHQIESETDGRRLPHVVLSNVNDDMLIMQNEIFGPILPIITYEQIDEVIHYINSHDRPLALYYFGYNKTEQQKILHATHSGGVCLNETLMTAGMEDMPFGGIGPSGMGHYHGHEGFKTFSHAKSVFSRPKFSLMKLIYPPYGSSILKLIYKFFLR
ncbi:coniferyl-aldehyde dehydrogenase [Acinetobacter sp. NCu2D-2]|uniref:coniferyl aldehyde dehydrogenase n=1 Tax=Acinetobacter sp. NCu2D-2 TaxID=1608473 RepID=UPI0007CDD8A6|nr:coniferyl aldehyde dehydrogenase [Acinetobacter sp. NCu2D-2]ANF81531.1 coniferyl-aldehyde dehydrogenase [Acinetobacter sp. NCu2D-2]